MRRLEEDEHASLLALTPPQRLFVQRWIELFDRDATLGVRCRPSWRSKITDEMATHSQKDFHLPIMQDEYSALADQDLSSFDFSLLESKPVQCADVLASTVGSIGFSHSFLYHGYKLMLQPAEVPFTARLEGIRAWWLANSKPRPITVVLVPTGVGAPPPKDASVSLDKWSALPATLRDHAKSIPECYTRFAKHAHQDLYLWVAHTSASDVTTAAAAAWELYMNYAMTCRLKKQEPVPLDTTHVLAWDPQQSPAAKNYVFKWQKYHFALPSTYDAQFLDALAKAALKSEDLGSFWKAYAKALNDVVAGNPVDALDDIAKGIDLAFAGYSPVGDEKDWKLPRLFVEKASLLLSLDWSATHFQYIRTYMLKPSFLLAGKSLVGSERRPEAVFGMLSNPSRWHILFAQSDWDELLKYRREELLRELSHLRISLHHRRRLARWNLARAVRARNALFHSGQPTRDQYLIAVLLQAFDLVLRLRVVAYKHAKAFDTLVKLAESDYALLPSDQPPTPALFASFGWRRWRSKHGDDIPIGP